MFFRLFLTVVFLGATIWSQFRYAESPLQPFLYPFYGIIIFVCLLTIAYSFLLKVLKEYKAFAYLQLCLDVFIITLTIFFTGGIESPFSFLYILSIISGSILLNRRGGLVVASLSSLSYGTLIDLQYYALFPWTLRLAPEFRIEDSAGVFFNIFITIVAFFTVALLSGYLAERVSRVEGELDATRIDFQRLESLSRGIIENVSSGILTIDKNNRITSFNRAAERITGLSLKDVYNKDIREIFPFQSYSDVLVSDSDMPRNEMVFKRRDDKEVYLGFSLSPLRDIEGEESGAILIFQDLTNLKKMEEEFRRSDRIRALGEMAAGMAHEIRNPLASISGSIEVLKQDLRSLNDDDRRLMDIVLRETGRLNSLITDFLVFAKPAPKKRRVNLHDVAEETINLLLSRRGIGGIKIVKELSDVVTLADPEQIKQVFWNLFLNAVEAMDGEGVLRVGIKGMNHGGEVEITVSDTGRGIKESYGEKIFDPFFTTKDGGTGLGLAVVGRIVEGHDGRIEVESKEGEGTTFRIRLPGMEGVDV